MDNNSKDIKEKKEEVEIQESEKTDIVNWIKTHLKEIAIITGSLGTTFVAGWLLGKNASKEQIEELKKQIENLTKDIKLKDLKLNKLEFENIMKDTRISQLVELCKEKDQYFKKMMSDAFRHGSSEGARQMAYKRHSNIH